MINENLKRKLKIFCDEDIIEFSNINNIKKVITKYKGFIIEAYNFSATIKAPKEVLSLIYDSGLGDRNSYGFGMIEKI